MTNMEQPQWLFSQHRNTSSIAVLRLLIFATFALLLGVRTVHAANPVYTSFLSQNAVAGYDTVAYFKGDKPAKGNKKFSTEYMGANWLFANQENLALFKADPEKYAPQYGGYCAYAAALGDTAKGDPLQWHIDDNKLYLNINAKIKKRWLKKKPEYIEKANKNWPGILAN